MSPKCVFQKYMQSGSSYVTHFCFYEQPCNFFPSFFSREALCFSQKRKMLPVRGQQELINSYVDYAGNSNIGIIKIWVNYYSRY